MSESEFKADDNKEYVVVTIRDSIVYISVYQEQLPRLYYLVSWKGYLKSESIWKSAFAIIYLRNMIKTFYKDYSEKPTITSPSTDFTPLVTRPSINLSLVS